MSRVIASLAQSRISSPEDGRYICDPNDVGGIEDYDQFGPGTWPASGRYTSLNGEIIPQFPAIQSADLSYYALTPWQ